MANEQNLRPKTTLSKEEAKKMGSLGGKASVKSRKEKKAIAEVINDFLNDKMTNETMIANLKQIKPDLKDIDNKTAMTIAQFAKAMQGDTRAFESLLNYSGEKPVEKIQHSGEVNNPFAGLTTEELRKLTKDD